MADREPSPWGGGGMDWASIPGKPRENLPASVPFKGQDVPIYTFPQIDRLGKKSLKDRAMNLRDLVGAANLPRFSPGMQDEQMVAWLLETQTIIAASAGISLTVADLGAPKGGDGVGAYLTHLKNAPSSQLPPPPQAQQQQFQQQQFQQQQQQQFQQRQQLPPPPQQHFHQPPPQFQQPEPDGEYAVEAILNVRTNPSGMATHFLIKWAGYPIEEATWESAAEMQAAAPEIVFQFKQQLVQQQRQRQPPPQQQYHHHHQQQQYQQQQQQQYQYQQQQYQQQQQQQQYQQRQQQYQPTDLRGNPMRSPQGFSPSVAGSPMRPDQESDLAREAARKRNMGSNPFG